MAIKISQLKETDKQRGVVYKDPSMPWKAPQDGIISSWNNKFIFVSYNGNLPQATTPDDLEFLS